MAAEDDAHAEPDHDHADHDHADHDHEPYEPDQRDLDRLAAALAAMDDASLRRGVAKMREQSRMEVAQHLSLSRATMSLGDALVPLLRRKVLTAPPERQVAVAFSLTEECNEATIAALGDRSESPTRDDMLEVLPPIIDDMGTATVTLMLASYAASDAACQAVFSGLLDDDDRFALGDPPAIDDDAAAAPAGITTLRHAADDPAQTEKRAQRKAAKAERRAQEAREKQAKAAGESARRAAQHGAKQRRPSR